MPAEGKTLTATNLALTLSESYQDRVLLIDADLRRPALHDVFRLSAGTGLLEGLTGDEGTKLVVRQVVRDEIAAHSVSGQVGRHKHQPGQVAFGMINDERYT